MRAMIRTRLPPCLGATFITGIILIGVLCSVYLLTKNDWGTPGELKQVHVIFSHGETSPTLEEIHMFPLTVNHNETFFPIGYGGLTNEGKMRMHKLGKRLRTHYNDFLGDKYDFDRFVMQSANTDVSRMSALLVASGIWPTESEDMWNIDGWQPIPYAEEKEEYDYLMFEDNCPRFSREKEEIINEFTSHNDLPYPQLYYLVSLYTGGNITDMSQIVTLYWFMEAQKHLTDFTPVWYRNLEYIVKSVINLEKKLKYEKPIMKELSSGYLLKNVLQRSMLENNTVDENQKMYCYSADNNVIDAILADTRMRKIIPKPGSMIIIELYSILSEYDDYVYKFLYVDGDPHNIIDLDLRRCKEPCFIHNLEIVLSETLAKDYHSECNS